MGNLVGILSSENDSLRRYSDLVEKENQELKEEIKTIKKELGLYYFQKIDDVLKEIRKLKGIK